MCTPLTFPYSITKYFTESLQLYVPPDYMLNRDFLKQVLAGQKRLMPLKDMKTVTVPKFEELAVDKIYPLVKVDDNVNSYFPDRLPKNRSIARDYFWTILNSVHEPYVQRLISHAQKQRYAAGNEEQKDQTVQVTDEWAELL